MKRNGVNVLIAVGLGLCVVACARRVRGGGGTWAQDSSYGGGGATVLTKDVTWYGASGNVYTAKRIEDLSPEQLKDVRKRTQQLRRAM